MLELKNIRKTYKIGEIETHALDDVSIAFRDREMVAILGTSGSGKTTLLNIIGGLDRYDSGELIIKGKNTKNFKEREWDSYRNNSIGFVFQSYNLIGHLSIVANVELSMTLTGVSGKERKKRAIQALKDVGLTDHLHKKPNQLSGGQMQRVAIARALVNNPEILLCDEPTGALDTQTSIQIMDLIKSIAKDRLVIMVTHNPDLAEEYTERIISFKDGHVISDTNPYAENPEKADGFSLKKTSMSFLKALSLSFNNIRTKKGRTFLTSFASSIGIIGIAVILSLSTGFQVQVDSFQRDAMSGFPIIISKQAAEIDAETMQAQQENGAARMGGKGVEYVDSDEVFLFDPSENTITHENKLTDAYLDYVAKIDPKICDNIGYTRIVNMNLLRETEKDGKSKIAPVSIAAGVNMGSDNSGTEVTGASMMGGSMIQAGLTSYPAPIEGQTNFLESTYDVLSGEYPQDAKEFVLIVDNKNRVDEKLLKNLGYEIADKEAIKFDDIVGTEIKLVANNDYYTKTPIGSYVPGNDYAKMFNSSKSQTLKLSGVLRQKPDTGTAILSTGFAYSDDLSQLVIDEAKSSDIVKAQKDSDKNIITMTDLSNDAKEQFLSYLGGNATPMVISMYPTTFDDKDAVLDYLDKWNDGKSSEDKVIYTDLAGTISSLTGGIMGAITIVLIAFSAISLIVSLIMVSIITYTSVLERTKEIGILKSLGARRKDITRVFNAETCLIGVFSGLLGVFIAWLLTFPINIVIEDMTDLTSVANLNPLHALLLVTISTLLTMFGGYVPAVLASRKDAVVALRTE